MDGEPVVPKVKPGLAWVELEGEVVVYDGDTGTMHMLNLQASEIWTRLNDGTSLDEITADLAHRYGVDPDQIRRDVTGLVEELTVKGLLERARY